MSETQKKDMHPPNNDPMNDDPLGSPLGEEPGQPKADPEPPPSGFHSAYPSEDKMHIERLEKELEKAKDQTLRAMAETENMRRRAAREKEDAGKYAISGFARDLISVADNLRRALDAVPADLAQIDDRLKSLLSGIEATEREMLSIFDRNGIKKLEPMHQIFDPNLHEVMFEAPIPGLPPGTICQLIQPGYTLHDRLLRPARVGVVKDAGAESAGPKEPPPEPGQNIDTQV